MEDADLTAFAKKLEDAENKLVEEGWTLTGVMFRGDQSALVNGQREEQAPTPVMPVSSQEAVGDGYTEVVYSYLEGGKLKDMRLPSVPHAIAAVRLHLTDASFVPNRIVVMNVIAYEPLKDLPVLERMYGDRPEV